MYKQTLKSTILALAIVSTILLSASSSVIAGQPKMQAALDALNVAERQLKKGSKDKGGHRVKALELVRQAKKEVRKAIKFDRKH